MNSVSEVTRILSGIESGDLKAAEQLLPLVYDELRKLAAAKLAHEKPGQTLQATALVHEAYLRLVGSACRAQPKPEADLKARSCPTGGTYWDSRGHFFAAAAEAMRRILVESARRKKSRKHGGEGVRLEFDDGLLAEHEQWFDLLELNDALTALERHDAVAAQLVKLRYFAGFGHQQAAEAMGITRREADGRWALARAWLFQQLGDANA
jgi:RNA polymerase sigma factor (TIGR02999 family)